MATTLSTTDGFDQQPPPMEQQQVAVVERQPKKKEVSFALTATIRMIPKINKSHPDASNIWYNRSDFEIFKVRDGYVMSLMMMMNNNGSTDAADGEHATSSYCTRGLEGRIGVGHERKISARDRARDAVFFQQDCYFIGGAGDDDEEGRILCPPEAIATAYIASCREAKEDARVRALNDEWYVLTEIRKNEEKLNKEKQLLHRSALSLPMNRQERRKPTVMDLSPVKQRRMMAGQAA